MQVILQLNLVQSHLRRYLLQNDHAINIVNSRILEMYDDLPYMHHSIVFEIEVQKTVKIVE